MMKVKATTSEIARQVFAHCDVADKVRSFTMADSLLTFWNGHMFSFTSFHQ